MKIGIYDADNPVLEKAKFPNLALMKISAYQKSIGHSVRWATVNDWYDVIYVSRVFGDEYNSQPLPKFKSKEIICGGTGYAISIENGKETYTKNMDSDLPEFIEHIYPDYSIYPHLTENTAYGFLTRGCCNNCDFCIVSKKEGRCSKKVADLSEFWNGQKTIKLLDPNLLACKDHMNLLQQLVDSKSCIDFTQGLDARLLNEENVELLSKIKYKRVHFAFDDIKNEDKIIKGLTLFKNVVNPSKWRFYVYVLTNYNSTFDEDYYRIKKLQEIGIAPDVRIYRRPTAPKLLKDLQRWCNNRCIYWTEPNFMNYIPRVDGKTIKEIYFQS